MARRSRVLPDGLPPGPRGMPRLDHGPRDLPTKRCWPRCGRCWTRWWRSKWSTCIYTSILLGSVTDCSATRMSAIRWRGGGRPYALVGVINDDRQFMNLTFDYAIDQAGIVHRCETCWLGLVRSHASPSDDSLPSPFSHHLLIDPRRLDRVRWHRHTLALQRAAVGTGYLTTPLINTPRHYTRPRVRANSGCWSSSRVNTSISGCNQRSGIVGIRS